jgi:ketosteroid isomerase-like protein
MSSDQRDRDIEALRAVYERWARGDFHDTDVFTDDIVWIPADAPESGMFRGIEEFAKSWRGFLEAWEGLRSEAEEIVPLSAGKYLVMQVFRATGRASGVETEAKSAVLVTMRGGRIARMEGFWDRDPALKAAGLQEGEW